MDEEGAVPLKREALVNRIQVAIVGFLSLGFFVWLVFASWRTFSLVRLVDILIYLASLFLALATTWMLLIVVLMVVTFYGTFGWDRLLSVSHNYYVYVGKLSKVPRSLTADVRNMCLSLLIEGIVIFFFHYHPAIYLYICWCYSSVVNISRVALVQPIGIFLASSNPRSNALAASLASLDNAHFCSFLDRRGIEGLSSLNLNWASHRRFDIGSEWESYVSGIVCCIPIVVVDLRLMTTALATEIEMLIDTHGKQDSLMNNALLRTRFVSKQILIILLESEEKEKTAVVDQLLRSSANVRAETHIFSELELFHYIKRRFRFRFIDTDEEFTAFMNSFQAE